MSSGTVPHLDQYVKNGFNVLLQGLHGTGKTQSLVQVCNELGLKVKYYSASTLDPYTDLVGVPVPSTTPEGLPTLTMVRPREIDEAEVVIFDELNRAEAKTRNAVMELVQFRAINGERLPNLKCVVAAVNPPGDDNGYDVEELDPALVDRFHVVLEVKPAVSMPYFTQLFGKEMGSALVSWWEGQNKSKRADYLSPRRLEMIGHVWAATPTRASVEAAMPPGGVWEVAKLVEALREATRSPAERAKALAAAETRAQRQAEIVGKRASVAQKKEAARVITVTSWSATELRAPKNVSTVVAALTTNPTDINLHARVAEAYGMNVAADTLAVRGEVFGALTPAAVSAMIGFWNPSKKSMVRQALARFFRTSSMTDQELEAQYRLVANTLHSKGTQNVLDVALAARSTTPSSSRKVRGRSPKARP